jgi:hypothetical protein
MLTRALMAAATRDRGHLLHMVALVLEHGPPQLAPRKQPAGRCVEVRATCMPCFHRFSRQRPYGDLAPSAPVRAGYRRASGPVSFSALRASWREFCRRRATPGPAMASQFYRRVWARPPQARRLRRSIVDSPVPASNAVLAPSRISHCRRLRYFAMPGNAPRAPHGDTIKSANSADLEIDVSALYLSVAPRRPRKYPFAEQSTAKLTSSHTTREPKQIGPSPEGPFFAIGSPTAKLHQSVGRFCLRHPDPSHNYSNRSRIRIHLRH